MVRVVEMGPWEMFDLSDGKWHILYDAWQPEDFELLAAAGIEPTSVLMSDKTSAIKMSSGVATECIFAFTSDGQGFGPVEHVPGNTFLRRW